MPTRVSPEARKLAFYLIEKYDHGKVSSDVRARITDDGPTLTPETHTTARDRKLDRDELKLTRFAEIDSYGVRDELITAGELEAALDALPAEVRVELAAEQERLLAEFRKPQPTTWRHMAGATLGAAALLTFVFGALILLGSSFGGGLGALLTGIMVMAGALIPGVAGLAIIPPGPKDPSAAILAAFERAFEHLPG